MFEFADGKTWCTDCVLRSMNPEPPKPRFIDHYALGIGLNAAQKEEQERRG